MSKDKTPANPSLIGMLAILVWGISLPVMRILAEKIGVFGLLGVVFGGAGMLGIISQAIRGTMPARAVFKNPYLYGRWLFFCVHEGFLSWSLVTVQKANVPFVILLNYLWPTAIIICSVMFAGIRVTRWPIFIVGLLIVLASLSFEILAPGTTMAKLFAIPSDCLAYALVFTGAMSWGIYSALTRRAGSETGGGAVVPFFQLTLALALPFSFLPGLSSWQNLTPALALVLCGWCFIQFCAYVFWGIGMQWGSIVALSLCADFIPWISLATAHVLLGVQIGPRTIISVISLVAGAMVARYGTLQKKLAVQDEPPII